MKKFVLFFIIFALAFAFFGCNGEEIPEENIGELEPVVSDIGKLPDDDKEKFAFYEEILLNFGALKTDSGEIKANKIASLYFNTDGFENGRNLDETSCFVWAMHYLNYRCEYDASELFAHPEFAGWAYPSEYYEPAVLEYFGIPAEELRKGELYNQEYDFYNIGGGGGIGDTPFIIFNGADEKEDMVELHLTLDFDLSEDCDMVLTVKLLPDGGYNYISYLPEGKTEEEAEKITLKLGANGEEKEYSVGDTIGEWKLSELFIDREDNGDYFEIEILFDGTVTLEGYIGRVEILEEGYDIVLNEDSLEKMPYLIAGDYSEIRPSYFLDFPLEFENVPSLDFNETAEVRITVSNFGLGRAPRMGMDGFDVVSIEYLEEDKEIKKEELYEEIILNFGAEKNKAGEYTLIKGGGGLFNFVKGFEDGSKMPAAFYHSWFSERCHHLGLSAAEFSMAFSPYNSDMGWVYPAQIYEPECIRFFGTTNEYLRSLENYVPKYDWYYLDTGAPGIGETPKLVINSIDENEDKVVFHVTLDYNAQEDNNMALTVKLLPDGGYNYISYLPE